MYAIVATGGKQLKVAPGDVVSVEKLDAPVGGTVTFTALLLSDDGNVIVDPAELAAVTVTGEVLEHYKGDKVVVFKFKRRKGYKRTKGHRQELTRVRITDVATGSAGASKKRTRARTAAADAKTGTEGAAAEQNESPAAEAAASNE